VNADPELDAALRRNPGVALDHAELHLDRAAHRVDNGAEFDQRTVASPLDDAAVMNGDGRVDEVAAECPQPRERAVFVRAGEPAETDHVGRENRCELPGLAHCAALRYATLAHRDCQITEMQVVAGSSQNFARQS
jgi:hypothetical protein